jgi:hypothetical protein
MHSAAPGVISPCRWTISCLSSRATRTANSDRKFEIECTLLPLSARGQGCWRATLATGLGAGGDSLVSVLRRLRIAARDQEVVAVGLGRSLIACVITVWIAGSI